MVYKVEIINGRKKKIYLEEPNIKTVLKPDFSYAKYRTQLIDLVKNNEVTEEQLQAFFAMASVEPDFTNPKYPKSLLEQNYNQEIELLQQMYEDGLLKGINHEKLDKKITKKMLEVALAYLPYMSAKNEKQANKWHTLLYNKEVKWNDVPIKYLDFTLLNSEQRIAFYILREGPNIPINYLDYTVRELAYMNEDYLHSKGKR